MIQSLHIFRKDVRHQWMDLLLYAVMLAAFGLVTPKTWPDADPSDSLLQMLSVLLKALIPLLWLVIIARLVHEEPLVGDQQFWVTRPYAWTSLLGAKLAFIVICIVFPFVVMQWCLLILAGLNPLATLPALLSSLPWFILIVWLPFAAVAAVTSNLSRTFMSLAAAVIVWAGILTLISGTAGPRMIPPHAPEACWIVVGGLLAAILIYQYAVRNTTRSRIALVATALLFLGMFWCFVQVSFAGPMSMLLRHDYPISLDKSLHLTFDPNPLSYEEHGSKPMAVGGLFTVNLPVHVDGLDPSARLHEDNVSFTIDAPGYHYISPWRPTSVGDRSLSLLIPQAAFNRTHAENVHMHLAFIAQRLLPGMPLIITAADHFNVPGNGNCVLLAGRPRGNVICRYAFQGPSPTRVNGVVAAQSCDSPGPTHPAVTVLRSILPGARPDPVIQEPISFGGAVCPGTQLTFVTYHSAGSFRLELDIPAVYLDHYVSD